MRVDSHNGIFNGNQTARRSLVRQHKTQFTPISRGGFTHRTGNVGGYNLGAEKVGRAVRVHTSERPKGHTGSTRTKDEAWTREGVIVGAHAPELLITL